MFYRTLYKTLIIVLFMSFLLSSCSFLSPVKVNPPTNYVLQDPSMEQASHSIKSNKVLLVSKIYSTTWLNNQRMAYQNNNQQIDYFTKNQWIAAPSQLLQPIVVHGLQNANIYRAVLSSPYSGEYSQRLDLHLLNFQQVFVHGSSHYWLTVQARLINNNTQKLIAEKRFNITVPAPTANPAGGVTAANQAIKMWLPQLVQFLRMYR